MRLGLLVNPTAGLDRGARYHAGAAHVLHGAGHSIVDLTGPDAASARENARANLAGLGALVVVGGDGSVQLGVNVVAGTSVPLGIIPAGTGNDNALSLGIPPDPTAAMHLILDQLRDQPSGVPTDAISTEIDGCHRWVMGTVSCGFDASVNEHANKRQRPKGSLRYVRALLETLPRYQAHTFQLTGDDWEWEGRALLAGIANGSYIGGGMRLAPDALPDDGLLDVVIVDGNISKLEILRVFPRIFAGTHISHPAVSVRRIRKLAVVDAGHHVAFGDGERLGQLPMSCEVVPGAVMLFRGAAPRPISEVAGK